jgi:quinol monooxygenase YgiN
MSLVVVAVLTAKPGEAQGILDALGDIIPRVHAEDAGCELYAAHLDSADHIVMVERWSSPETLDAHAKGANLADLNERIDRFMAKPMEVYVTEAKPFGDPVKGALR